MSAPSITELMTAWDNMDNAAQRMLTSLPHQISESAARLDAARLEMRGAVQKMMRYAATAPSEEAGEEPASSMKP